MREQHVHSLDNTKAVTRRLAEHDAMRTLRLRRASTTMLVIMYVTIIVVGILTELQFKANWNMQLDPQGPQSLQTCSGTSCSLYGWKITSELVGGNADVNGIATNSYVCGFYTNSGLFIPVSASTRNANDILESSKMVIFSSGNACDQQQNTVNIGLSSLLSSVIDLVIALICAILATLIFLHSTQRSLAIHTVALFSCLIVAFSWLPVAPIAPQSLGTIEAIAATTLTAPLLATLLWRLLFATPERKQQFRWLSTVIMFFFLISAGIIIGIARIVALVVQMQILFDSLNSISLLLFAISIIIALGVVIISNLSRRASVKRDYARILGAGSVVALLPIFIFNVLPEILHSSTIIDPSLSVISVIALPLSFAYVVLRRDLLGVTSLVRTTTEQSLRVASLAFIAALILSIVAAIIKMPAEAAALIFVALFLIALFSSAIQGAATWITERWIFPEVNRYRGILSRASAATVKAGIAEPHEIANEMIGEVKLALPVRKAVLFVGNKETGQFILLIDDTDPNALVTIFDSNHPVPELLRSRGGVINQGDLQEIKQRMTIALMTVPGVAPDIDPAAGWDTFVPIMLRDELIAILVLGERDDEFDYSSTDRALLLTLSNRRALALDYARVVADLRVAYEQQKELDEMKDQFIMTAHHELRTPLTGLLGYVELLRDMGEDGRAATPGDVEYFLNSASKAGEDLANLMTALLQADQKNINRTRLHPVLMDVSIALQAVANSVDMSFNRNNHRITVRCDQHLKAWADPQALSRVLTNLLSNAIKYSPEQSPVLITAHRRPDVEAIEIIVRDWGSGIPAEEQRKVFERFVRLERDLNSPVRGSGLGLYVARTLIESMGGRIWVESSGQTGMGTTFRIVLPIMPPLGQPVEEERPATQPQLARQPAPFTPIQQMDTDPRLKTLAPTKRRLDGEFHFPNDTPGFP